MKTERFNNAMTALTQAFFNGTLAKGDCRACAVGSMVAHANGIKLTQVVKELVNEPFIEKGSEEHSAWKFLGATVEDKKGKQRLVRQYLAHDIYFGAVIFNSNEQEIEKALKYIKPTGYTESEILQIENAFENSSQLDITDYCKHTQGEIMQDQYNGLCAVVDVLCKLDGIEPASQKEFFAYDQQLNPVHQYV